MSRRRREVKALVALGAVVWGAMLLMAAALGSLVAWVTGYWWPVLGNLLVALAVGAVACTASVVAVYLVADRWTRRSPVQRTGPVESVGLTDRAPFLGDRCSHPPQWKCRYHGECRGCECACDTFESEQLQEWDDDYV